MLKIHLLKKIQENEWSSQINFDSFSSIVRPCPKYLFLKLISIPIAVAAVFSSTSPFELII